MNGIPFYAVRRTEFHPLSFRIQRGDFEMTRLLRASLLSAFVLTAVGCKDSSGGGRVIAPTDTKPAPKVVTAGGGAAPAQPKLPNKGPD
jgi:hypothetical protein